MSPLYDRLSAGDLSVTAPRAGASIICRRALAASKMLDDSCPFSHDWLDDGGGTSIPFTRSPHDVRTSAEARDADTSSY